MLIKLRVHTTQPLVIIFAEFSDDFFWLFGFLPTKYQFASSWNVTVPGVGSEDACLLPV